MEWVETTGRTIEEARELALDQLGVDSSEAEFETLEEPRSGLFGRTRGTARVRARVAPRSPRPKTERKRRGRRSDGDENGASSSGDRPGSSSSSDRPEKGSGGRGGRRGGSGSDSGPQRGASNDRAGADASKDERQPRREASAQKESRTPMDTQEQMDVLEEFLVELADGFGIAATAVSRMEDNVLTVDLQGDDLGLLVGPRLATLDAVQEVARHALQRQAAGREYAKVVVDAAGIRQRRTEALAEFVRTAAERVSDEDAEVVFEVMSSVDRKQVHDLVAELDGVESSSEGEDPRRRVVLRRA